MIQVPYYPLTRVVDSYGGELQKAVSSVVESGWFIRGKECEKFERDFATYCGARFCIGVGNGLEALSLILKGYMELGRLDPGDGVIVPTNTFIATWLAVKAAGLVPVPCEPDAETCVLNLHGVENAFLRATYSNVRVKAILAVHLYGRLCPMERLKAFAEDRDLLLLEDAAQAHGAAMNWPCGNTFEVRRAGNLGDAAGFSFYPGKNLGALGDGGAVVTSDEKLAEVVRMLSNYGSKQKYVHEYAGENSRLDELQAAALSIKLPRLDRDNGRRNEIAQRYLAEIKNPVVRLPLAANVFDVEPDDLNHGGEVCSRENRTDGIGGAGSGAWGEECPKIAGRETAGCETGSREIGGCEIGGCEIGGCETVGCKIGGCENRAYADCVWHIFAIHCQLPDGTPCRNELQQHLKNRGVETLIHYPTPPHLQKAFFATYGMMEYSVAEHLAATELSLPLHPYMTENEIWAVIEGVNSFRWDCNKSHENFTTVLDKNGLRG